MDYFGLISNVEFPMLNVKFLKNEMNDLLKVLIVDDEADARNTLRVFLAEFNQVRGFKIFNSNFTTILA